MGEELESGGAGASGSRDRTKTEQTAEPRRPAGHERDAQGTLQPTTRRPAPVAPPDSGPPRPRAPRGAGAAPQPHRELFLLLGSTPLKVVVVVMVPRSEVGWRGSRALGRSGPRGAEQLPTTTPATAAGASATACLTGRSLYKARKYPPPPCWYWPIQIALFVPIGSLKCQASGGTSTGCGGPAQPKPAPFLVWVGLWRFPLPHPQISVMIGQRTNLPRAGHKLCSLSLKKVT